MVRGITLNGSEVEFKCSAALPIIYRQIFPDGNFWSDITKVESDVTYAFQIAFAMYKHANPKERVDFIDWLTRYEFIELTNNLSVIVEMLTNDLRQTSDSKKKREK